MGTVNVLEKISFELKKLCKNPKNIKDYSKFHKDGKIHIGIATPLVRKVAFKNFKEVKNLEKKQIFSLCEKLLKINGSGYRDIAFDWAFRIRKQYQKEDYKIFESWLKNYVDTWGSCDDLCTHAFGEFICQFPEFLPQTKQWAKSSNKWFRRASAVVLIYSLRKGKYLKEAFSAAKILLQDKEDLAQKGYGWMLKEASNLHQKEVFDFVIKNRKLMPRTALRYAIEKLPEKLKIKARAKE
ncbi:MAG: DNA alkylation repair protein [bacterium]|nr:DNA alkylation repair protein [bacterium]